MEFELTLDAVAQRPELAQLLSPEIIRVLRLRARIALAALDECPTQPASLAASQLELGDSLVASKRLRRCSTFRSQRWPTTSGRFASVSAELCDGFTLSREFSDTSRSGPEARRTPL